MTGLQEAFYIVALVYMGVSLLIIIVLAVAVGVIRKKIVNLEHIVAEKIDFLTSLPTKVESIIDIVKTITNHGDHSKKSN